MKIGDTIHFEHEGGALEGTVEAYRERQDIFVVTVKTRDGRVITGVGVAREERPQLVAQVDLAEAEDIATAIVGGLPVLGSVTRQMNLLAHAVVVLANGRAA